MNRYNVYDKRRRQAINKQTIQGASSILTPEMIAQAAKIEPVFENDNPSFKIVINGQEVESQAPMVDPRVVYTPPTAIIPIDAMCFYLCCKAAEGDAHAQAIVDGYGLGYRIGEQWVWKPKQLRKEGENPTQLDEPANPITNPIIVNPNNL